MLTLLFTVNTEGRFPEKTAVLLDFVQITSPAPSPQFGQLVQLFSDVGIQDLKESIGLKILYVLYFIPYIYNLKKQFKVRIQLHGIDTIQSSNHWHIGRNGLLY